MKNRFLSHLALTIALALALSTLCPVPGCHAQEFSLLRPVSEYFHNWFPRVEQIQAGQPHWITPLATVTPLLEQEVRYDQSWQSRPNGVAVDDFGGGKGVELIPWYNVETIFGIPPYLARNRPRGVNGFGDYHFLLIKYRLLSATAENGDYVLSAFMGFSAPTATQPNTQGVYRFTPTVAFGKGFGNFDFQSTASAAFPNRDLGRAGIPVRYNIAFQYRVMRLFWPEIEANYTYFDDGEHAGKSQLYLTPGIVIGKIPLHNRIGLTIGTGVQIAVTRYRTYNQAWIISARIPF